MTSDRMRRVNEAVREVLSGAITSELKDPRVGFVTVTAVETSPDLRHARVFVSVLGNPGERRRTLQALDSAHGYPPAPRRRRAADQAHAAARSSSMTTLRSAGCGSRSCSTRRTPSERLQRGAVVARGGRCGRSARTSASCLTTHERPDGDAVGSLAAMQQVLAALGKDAVAFMPADEFPLPYEYRFIKLEGLATEPPADLCSRTLIFLDCGNIDRTPVEQLRRDDGTALIVNIDHHHDNTRFGTINHVDPQASCTAEMVWDLMHGLGVELDAVDRRGAVRRPGDRHRALHVREHRAARARDGGRADRRRASTRTRSTGASTRASRRASWSCWRAG